MFFLSSCLPSHHPSIYPSIYLVVFLVRYISLIVGVIRRTPNATWGLPIQVLDETQTDLSEIYGLTSGTRPKEEAPESLSKSNKSRSISEMEKTTFHVVFPMRKKPNQYWLSYEPFYGRGKWYCYYNLIKSIILSHNILFVITNQKIKTLFFIVIYWQSRNPDNSITFVDSLLVILLTKQNPDNSKICWFW